MYALDALDLCERIQAIINTIADTTDFCNIALAESGFNHSHEDILELVDSYNFTGMRYVGTWTEPVEPKEQAEEESEEQTDE